MSALLVALVLPTAACRGNDERRAADPCARAAKAAPSRVASPLRGDVDGDGSPDVVGLARVSGAPKRCSLFLAVRGRGPRSLALRNLDEDPAVPAALVGLAAIDGRPGLEVLAVLHRGASTESASVFSVRRGRFAWLTTGAGDEFDGFTYFGSVTHVQTVDCLARRRGIVAASAAGPVGSAGRRWRVETSYYRVAGTRFRLIKTTRATVRAAGPPLAAMAGGNGRQPFPTCMKVRAPE